jgi:hypothetical protein
VHLRDQLIKSVHLRPFWKSAISFPVNTKSWKLLFQYACNRPEIMRLLIIPSKLLSCLGACHAEWSYGNTIDPNRSTDIRHCFFLGVAVKFLEAQVLVFLPKINGQNVLACRSIHGKSTFAHIPNTHHVLTWHLGPWGHGCRFVFTSQGIWILVAHNLQHRTLGRCRKSPLKHFYNGSYNIMSVLWHLNPSLFSLAGDGLLTRSGMELVSSISWTRPS